MNIDFILIVAACICFALAAFTELGKPRLNMVALGLLFWALTALIK